MGRSRPAGVIAAVALLATLLAGCEILGFAPSKPAPAPHSVAPLPQQYTCEESRQAGVEYRALPPGSMLRRYMDDYGAERRRLRAVHKLPEPARCPSR